MVNMMVKRNEEHSFSVEMRSKDAVKTLSFIEKENGNFFFEGFLGKIKNISMVEDVMLEIEGQNGIIKLDITSNEIENCVSLNSKKEIGGETQ
jgi:hypothetical protein